MNPLDLLDRPIAFHRAFVTITGSIKAALMLSQAIYWSKRTRDADGWFYKSAKEWGAETGLTRHEQDAARKLLADVMEEKLSGMPATVHFRVSAERLKSWLAKTGEPVCRKPANWFAENRQSTNSTETTSQTTAPAHAEFITLWVTAYQDHFKVGYAFQGGKDGNSVKHLLAASKLNPAELVEIARQAWKHGGFFCKSAASITGFYSKFNEIRQELKDGPHPKTATWGGRLTNRNAGTANAGRASDYAGTGKV